MFRRKVFIFILAHVILLPSLWASQEVLNSDLGSDSGELVQFIVKDFKRNIALSNICEDKPLREAHTRKIEEFTKKVICLSKNDLIQTKNACLFLKKLETTTTHDIDKMFLFIQLTGIQNPKDLMTLSPQFQQVLVDMLLYCGFYNFWRSPIRIGTSRNSLTEKQQLAMCLTPDNL